PPTHRPDRSMLDGGVIGSSIHWSAILNHARTLPYAPRSYHFPGGPGPCHTANETTVGPGRNDCMDCGACKTPNPEGANFCANCGSKLGAVDTIDPAILQHIVRQQVTAALHRDEKDLRISEFDITEKVATRLLGWAKNFGVVLGILLVIGGFLGFKNVKDVVDDLRNQANTLEGNAKKEFDELKRNVDASNESIETVKKSI